VRSFALLVAALLWVNSQARAGADAPLELEHGSFAVDARALSYFCAGEGSPTLILEAPSGISNHEAYANVLPELVKEHRVCAYERAGYGGSPALPPGLVQSLGDYVRELEHFLALEATHAPFVLLGYSYGGLVARAYTARNPDETLGIVLIDSPHSHWMREMKARMSTEDWSKVDDILKWFIDNRGHDAWISSYEMEAAPPLPRGLPVAVITRAQDHERMLLSGISPAGYRIYNDVHYELAPELLKLTERTVGFTANESQHFVPDTEPEIIYEAIRTVVAMGKQGGP
jgi:pimeloyl-ACP methyl ester carboxylesterase